MFTENQSMEDQLMVSDRSGEIPAPKRVDPLRFVRRNLRGVIGWAIFLGLITGGLGAVVGWLLTKPLYKSEGLIRIAYQRPSVMAGTDQNDPIPMFDSYMRSQQLRMMSRSTIEQALKDPAWVSTGRGDSAVELAQFSENLTVDHPEGTEHLRVMYLDEDPLVSAIAVNALINAFSQDYNSQDAALQQKRIAAIQSRQTELRDELQAITAKADRIAVMDSVLRQYIAEESQLEEQLADLRQQGYMEGHPRIVALQQALDHRRQQTAAYIAALHQESPANGAAAAQAMEDGAPIDSGLPTDGALGAGQAAGAGTNPAAATSVATGVAPDAGIPAAGLAADANADDVQTRREMIALGSKKLELERLQADGENVRKELADATDRLQALKVEAALGGRLEVISDGDVALTPAHDRRKLFAAAGGVAGGCLPAFLIVMLGTVRPRYRYAEETEIDTQHNIPLLGILPVLSETFSDEERSASAAQAIHQMRVLLQVGARGQSRTYLVTSACAGEGKTSLTVALGLSFAASGVRTLLVDCDLVGRKLTEGFGAGDSEGLYEAIFSENPGTCIRKLSSGAWLLPVGQADSMHAASLSSAAIQQLLDEARKEFQVILIDSGPILGSVEASMVAPEVDGVIVTIARGQLPSMVTRVTRHLSLIGANIAGMVFNRAKSRDFYRSSYGSISRPTAVRSMASRAMVVEPMEDQDGLGNFGPLVTSVYQHLPAPRRPSTPLVTDQRARVDRQNAPMSHSRIMHDGLNGDGGGAGNRAGDGADAAAGSPSLNGSASGNGSAPVSGSASAGGAA
jgi:Mrp family chromosome partitioning ATPase/uncharacterized protein involved in exopolysaccharide biosynthesis